jgi:hypothetical protein
MSAFLGFIHYWLYNKIRLVAQREDVVYQKAAALCGPTVEELRAQVWGTYGEPLPDTDLSELIDQSNIHGWLQRQINVVETREAAFVKALVDTCGNSGKDVVEAAFAEHGQSCGRHACQQAKYDDSQADGIYKALNDYFLNGMPCDSNMTVTENTPELVAWESSICLKARNWSRAEVSPDTMRVYYRNWLAGFVEGMNNAFEHKMMFTEENGLPKVRHEIRKRETAV